MAPLTPEDFFALPFYNDQAGIVFPDKRSAYAHFCEKGQRLGLKPCPHFYTSWYKWRTGCRNPLSHFATFPDVCPPAPYLDRISFLEQNPGYANMGEALAAMASGIDTSVSPELSVHLDQLCLRQKRIHEEIHISVVGNIRQTSKNLVWVQRGPSTKTEVFVNPPKKRDWDILYNWYNPACIDLRYGDINIIQGGTKSTAIHTVIEKFPELLDKYSYIAFFDDDVEIAESDISKLFDIAEEHQLHLFQPSLLSGSHDAWPDLYRKGTGVRCVTGVEIMMPCFSRDMLFHVRDAFTKSVSGYGADLLFSHKANQLGSGCWVLDDVGARHERPVNETRGAYYRLMRRLGIIPHFELYLAIIETGTYPTFKTHKTDSTDSMA